MCTSGTLWIKIVIASRNTETHARYLCTCVEKNNAAVIMILLHYIKVEPNELNQ